MIFAKDDYAISDAIVTPQGLFDLFQLDAETTNFDLIIDSTQELEISVRAITDDVAGLIEAAGRIVNERIANEFFGSQVGTIYVAAGDARAADIQLSGNSDRRVARVSVA